MPDTLLQADLIVLVGGAARGTGLAVARAAGGPDGGAS